MKKKQKTTQPIEKYPPASNAAAELKEIGLADEVGTGPMIRTQIYLNSSEHEFLRREAFRRDQPMAAVIREFIDEKMEIPEDAWANNPMLRPTVPDPDWKGHEDGGINHDHYISGGPKQWVKVKGKYVSPHRLCPAIITADAGSREDHERKLRKLDETR